jgi:dephospho-CoA kinase
VSLKLLITGRMGSGKSLAADYLVERHGAQRWSRTELMKRLAHAIADHVGDPEDVLRRIFPDPAQREEVRQALFSYDYVEEPGKPRRLYQDITEIRQDFDPVCFEAELEQRIRAVGEGPASFSLIDDVRKRSAFEYFTERGYRSLRIDAPEEIRRQRMLVRDGYLPDEETFQHSSEVELDEVDHEALIVNDSADLAAFYAELDALIERWMAEPSGATVSG